MLGKLHHVAFVVESVDSAMEFMSEAFGLEPVSRERFERDGVDLAIYELGDSFFEVTAPIGKDSALSRFLAENGAGIQHVAFEVEDIGAGLQALVNRRVVPAGARPRAGRSGWTVVDVDSKAQLGVAVQLVQSLKK